MISNNNNNQSASQRENQSDMQKLLKNFIKNVAMQ